MIIPSFLPMPRGAFAAAALSTVLATAAFFTALPARAGAPSDPVVSARLIDGGPTARGTRMAALHLKLVPGWKTYWRSPGDAGLPPRFGWDGSRNLGAVSVMWPSPSIFDSNGLTAIGYHDELVLPIEMTPKVPGRPIRVESRIDLGVCKDICVPVSLSLKADLKSSATSPVIEAALRRMPLSAARAGVGPARCEVTPISDGLRLTVHLPGAAARGDRVVVEPQDPSIWVADPEITSRGGTLSATTELVPSNATPFLLDRGALRFTVLGGAQAVDVRGCTG